MLNLSKNNIPTIEGLRELTRLRVLDLSYNRIFRIGHGMPCFGLQFKSCWLLTKKKKLFVSYFYLFSRIYSSIIQIYGHSKS